MEALETQKDGENKPGATPPPLPPTTPSPASSAAPTALSAAEAIKATEHWQTLTYSARAELDSVFRQPLYIRASGAQSGIEVPISARNYVEARFSVSSEPSMTSPQNTILRDVLFGYLIKGQFRQTGKVDFLVIDPNGQVVEVGAGSPGTISVFKENIFGKNISADGVKRQYTINEMVIKALQKNPDCAAALDSFVAKRKHEPEWARSAELAYYDPRSFDILKWGAANGIKPSELYQAGFVDRQLTNSRVPNSWTRVDVVH